jgi:hypothetical protein
MMLAIDSAAVNARAIRATPVKKPRFVMCGSLVTDRTAKT